MGVCWNEKQLAELQDGLLVGEQRLRFGGMLDACVTADPCVQSLQAMTARCDMIWITCGLKNDAAARVELHSADLLERTCSMSAMGGAGGSTNASVECKNKKHRATQQTRGSAGASTAGGSLNPLQNPSWFRERTCSMSAMEGTGGSAGASTAGRSMPAAMACTAGASCSFTAKKSPARSDTSLACKRPHTLSCESDVFGGIHLILHIGQA